MVEPASQSAVVIEDDESIRELIGTILTKLGLEVIEVGTAAEGLTAIKDHAPVLVTLDINLPGMDGFEAAQRIRAISQSYLVMITARDEEIDTLQGLGAGADDYVVKPFRPRELRARVEAMLRRPRVMTAPIRFADAADDQDDLVHGNGERWLVHNGLRLEAQSRTVEFDGATLDLTPSEFDLLHTLMQSGRRVRDKAELARHLRGDDEFGSGYTSEADRRSVEVHVSNLRRKLGVTSVTPRIIETVRGVGYRLTLPEQPQDEPR